MSPSSVPEVDLVMKYRMDDTPAKIWGGSILEIGGRDHALVRGAGVERALHTVRMFVITHPEASGIIVEDERPFGRIIPVFCADCGYAVCLGAPLAVLFRGVDLLGVFWSPRGVVAFPLEGVRSNSFLGVDGLDVAREGVPGTEPGPPTERFISAMLLVSDRSRNAKSFLYTRGGHGGWPRRGGSFNARLNLYVFSSRPR